MKKYVKVEGVRLPKLILRAVRQAWRVLEQDPETKELLDVSLDEVILQAPYRDEETSRHLSDDRDIFIIEGKTKFGAPVFFSVDFVHEEAGDRRGHCVMFDINTVSHRLEGVVVLPLPGDDCQRPFVSLESISSL